MMAIEDRVFGLAIEVGLRCKLVLNCEPAMPANADRGSKGMQSRGSI